MPRLQGICFLIALTLCGASFAAQVDVMLEQGDAPTSEDRMGELLEPLVHYPDDIVGVIFSASQQPEQVALAARYLSDPTSVSGEPDFSDEILALMQYPTLLMELSENLVWLSTLSNALLEDGAKVWAALEQQRQEPKPELGTITVPRQPDRVVYRAGPNSYVKRSSWSPRNRITTVYHAQPRHGAYWNRRDYQSHYDYWLRAGSLSHWHFHRDRRRDWRSNWRSHQRFGHNRRHHRGWSYGEDVLYRQQRRIQRQIARDHRQDHRDTRRYQQSERHPDRHRERRDQGYRANTNERPTPRRDTPRPYMSHDGPLR